MGREGRESEEEVTGAPDDDYTELQAKRARVHEWLFLTGSRWVVAGGILLLFLAVLAGIEFRVGTGSQQLVPLFYMSSAIIGGNFTLVTIVISISQLVISRQLSDPGEQKRRIERATEFRDDSAESAEALVPPPTPGKFLEVLLEGVRNSVRELDDHRSAIASDDAVEALDRVLDPLEDHVGRSIQKLEQEDTTVFEALVVTLNTNYSEDINEIRRLQTAYRSKLSPEAKDSLDGLASYLKHIDVARQYLKTVYIQEELARLSRNLLYVGVPVILIGIALMDVFVSTRQAVLSPGQLSVVTLLFATASGAPLALLFAYVLRLTVVSERTAAVTPFTTPTQEATPVEAISDDVDD